MTTQENISTEYQANNAENISGIPPMQIFIKTTSQVVGGSGFDAHVYSLIIK
jgi:hypothetical protein